ncbi:MAG: signal peptide peptidase SppA [Cytophagaceae bacterium]|nr:signal peptide peptidase SppA [Cytophagaceae bacterium]
MSKFWKYFLAVVIGGLVSAFIITMGVFLLMGGIVAASGNSEVVVKNSSILVMDLNSPIAERADNDPFSNVIAEMMGQPKMVGLNKILASIKKAKEDDRIKGIYMESGLLTAGFATIDEIRNALLDFKKSGKFVYSFASIYTQKAYYLASAADKVYLNPSGMLEFKGIASSHTFFKGALEKLGVEVQVFKYGQFKSAVEPFIQDKMSDANRLQTETYVGSIWNHTLKGISASRGLGIDALNKIADDFAMLRDDDYLKNCGLIDGLVYKDEVLDMLKELAGTATDKDLNAVTIGQYADAAVPNMKKNVAKDKIAIIYAEGEITDGEEEGEGIVSGPLSRTIRKARRDESVKAIVLRVNSPGGSGLASEVIWREMQLAKEAKPVVVSMGDVAASGGYYISCAADTIIAQPNTLTGSIGVFGMVPNTSGLMKKIGVTTDRVVTNKMSDLPSINRAFTEEEKALWQSYVNHFYEVFIGRCADGRKTTSELINEVGEGRVWSGENAIAINLVDKLGGIDDAIATAARMANLENYRVVEMPEMVSPFERMMKELSGGAIAKIERAMLGEEYRVLKTINTLKSGSPIQARMPYELSVY